MDRQALIHAINALFPPEYILDTNKGIGLTLLYHRRAVVHALHRAQSWRETEMLARTLLLRQAGMGKLLWQHRDVLLQLLSDTAAQ